MFEYFVKFNNCLKLNPLKFVKICLCQAGMPQRGKERCGEMGVWSLEHPSYVTNVACNSFRFVTGIFGCNCCWLVLFRCRLLFSLFLTLLLLLLFGFTLSSQRLDKCIPHRQSKTNTQTHTHTYTTRQRNCRCTIQLLAQKLIAQLAPNSLFPFTLLSNLCLWHKSILQPYSVAIFLFFLFVVSFRSIRICIKILVA